MMIVDALCLLGRSLYGRGVGRRELMGRMRSCSIEKALVSCATPPSLDLKGANARLLRACDGKRLYPLLRVDLRRYSLQSLEEARERGFKGLYINPLEQPLKVNAEGARALYDACERLGLPIIVEAGYPFLSTPTQLLFVAEDHPHLRLILTAGAQSRVDGLGQFEVIELLASTPNLYITTSGIPETGLKGLIEAVVERAGAERVLFASSFPLLEPELELERVTLSNLSDEELSLVLGGNAVRIFSLGNP